MEVENNIYEIDKKAKHQNNKRFMEYITKINYNNVYDIRDLKILLMDNVNINVKITTGGKHYTTALHRFCQNEFIDLNTLQLLINNKADVNIKNSGGMKPIFSLFLNDGAVKKLELFYFMFFKTTLTKIESETITHMLNGMEKINEQK